MRKKLIKRGSIILIFIVLILVISYFFVGNYFYNFAINANSNNSFSENSTGLEFNNMVNKEREVSENLEDEKFMCEHIPTSLSIISDDKLHLNLHADIYENEKSDSKWVILVHGYGGKTDFQFRWIRNLYEKGYNVLSPDLRGHGKSEGNYIGMGWDDRLDIVSWVDEIVKINPDSEIIMLGISMGAATVMNTSGEDLPSNVKAIIEDCGYTSTEDIFAYQLKSMFNLAEFPVLYAANTVTKIRAGYDIFGSSAMVQVAKSKTPMLFIHGDQDDFVPYEMLDQVYEVANVVKEKLVVEGAGHADAIKVNPDLYWNTIWEFVDQNSNERNSSGFNASKSK